MQTESFCKTVKIIKKLLVVSKFAKSLHHNSFDDTVNMKGMTDNDKNFLQ
jgi:hypothetical protein